jgi:DNA-binding LytR/AlgR family response regulator
MKTRCLIVDDEPLAIKLMESHIEKLENLEVVGTSTNAMLAFDILREKKVDLLFLDIQMPQITGIDFLKTLKNPPKVIITTAYRQYALEGYELDVIDYLLKPISFERFLKAVNKYYHYSSRDLNVVTNTGSSSELWNAYMDVKENKRVIRINLKDIKFIEGLNEYVGIHTDERRIVTKTSLTKIEEKLPGEQFIRIHKSFIVPLAKINAFSSTSVEVDNKELPIGRSYKNMVMKTLNYTGD